MRKLEMEAQNIQARPCNQAIAHSLNLLSRRLLCNTKRVTAIALFTANVKLRLTLGTLLVPRLSWLLGTNWSLSWLKQFLCSLFVGQLYRTLRMYTGFWIGRLPANGTNFSCAYWVLLRVLGTQTSVNSSS